jgi:hypothetical protein
MQATPETNSNEDLEAKLARLVREIATPDEDVVWDIVGIEEVVALQARRHALFGDPGSDGDFPEWRTPSDPTHATKKAGAQPKNRAGFSPNLPRGNGGPLNCTQRLRPIDRHPDNALCE